MWFSARGCLADVATSGILKIGSVAAAASPREGKVESAHYQKPTQDIVVDSAKLTQLSCLLSRLIIQSVDPPKVTFDTWEVRGIKAEK